VRDEDDQYRFLYKFPRSARQPVRKGICGTWRASFGYCDQDRTVVRRRLSCKHPECPAEGCFEAWCVAQAQSHEARLEQAKTLWKGGDIRHFALSPHKDVAKTASHKWLLAEGQRIVLEEMNLQGGAVYYHRWRDGTGRRVVDPHLHVIGHGWARNSDQVYAKTGWVYKNIDAEQKIRPEDRDIAATVFYLLTHAPLIYAVGGTNRLPSWRWFGHADGSHLSRDGHVVITEAQVCPGCGDDLALWFGDPESSAAFTNGETWWIRSKKTKWKRRT